MLTTLESITLNGPPRQDRNQGAVSRYASIGINNLMSSLGLLTLRPFVIPQSDRLMVAAASAPHIGFLLNGFSPQTKFVTLKLTGLVTPIIVKSPSTPTTRSPSNMN